MPGSYGKEGTPLVILKVIVWQYYVMFSDKTLTPNCVCVGGGGGGGELLNCDCLQDRCF